MLLFGLPEYKDELGTAAYDEHGIVQETVRMLKKHFPDLVVITDVCLCGYTSHGHCGVVSDGEVSNDKTLPLIAQIALSHAQAGADIVAPSDMMDGRVKAIREKLDSYGFSQVAILSYAAKFASAFYGPFREVSRFQSCFWGSPFLSDEPGQPEGGLQEVLLDLAEGADMVMVNLH